ncbi:sensor histidine kinase [Thermocoleostomius sinensis]|uniref:CHASE2 domain-containing protein n=1 Tax=Thermocoleostomius sinensis A174 TaxID=2016057 RepID=A0A9E8ZAQ3_9CYAN|nr:CHASE2 domain-containing protein [Thermocoleostomius sinensis]WAL59376.1 CHASE2 domain-containing protein [Thermocoleostomius sinensis A174]
MKRYTWEAIRKELILWRIGALPGLLVIGLVVLLRLTGSLQQMEWWSLDHLLRSRPNEPTDDRVLIVGIDEADINEVGVHPIPDQQLAALLKKLQTYQPAAIGIDIVRDLPIKPGEAELEQVFQTHNNIIGIEKVLPDDIGATIDPPRGLPPQQVGFADVVLDQDSSMRRSLLGTPTKTGDYQFSLALRLAWLYLDRYGCQLANGVQDIEALSFCSVELRRFQPNDGGYIHADARGNQILINYRSGEQPFRRVSMIQVLRGEVAEDWIRDRVILIGVTATSGRDMVKSEAVDHNTSGLIFGIETHAHVTSQIISMVLDDRPALMVWSDGWDYVWIIGWGLLGILFGRIFTSPVKTLLGLGIAVALLFGISYTALVMGWWLPIVPAAMVLVLNGAGLTASLFYRYQQDLKARIQDRQQVIDQTFDAIHNGPLQTLARLLRNTQEQVPLEQLHADLERLNQELRSVYEAVQQESLPQSKTLYLCNGANLNLQHATHELLHEVYRNTMTRSFPCFKTVKAKIVSFEHIDDRPLSLEQKRGLCRFLEEALCNAGKYATGMTRLEVVCKPENHWIVVRVVDNGLGIEGGSDGQMSPSGGRGTRQAKQLARQLNGMFRRSPNRPKGTICEISYPMNKLWFR